VSNLKFVQTLLPILEELDMCRVLLYQVRQQSAFSVDSARIFVILPLTFSSLLFLVSGLVGGPRRQGSHTSHEQGRQDTGRLQKRARVATRTRSHRQVHCQRYQANVHELYRDATQHRCSHLEPSFSKKVGGLQVGT
jgi:hypothetical protein